MASAAATRKKTERGTVTNLSTLFPAEQVKQVSTRVQATITEKRSELNTLSRFEEDNTSVINLVHRLPDELHHNIMVPFGPAAFFPGRLVHTNELFVLLGENYYAERTAKQTVDILKRRGKTLESQVNALKAEMKELESEASFFERTATEAAEGLVEIREELTDEDSEDVPESGASKVSETAGDSRTIDDKEYARIMSKMDELEKEELEAEGAEEQDDKQDTDSDSTDQENCEDEYPAEVLPNTTRSNDVEELNMQSGSLSFQGGHKDEICHPKDLMHSNVQRPAVKDHVPSVMKTSMQSSFKSKSQTSIPTLKPNAGSQIPEQASGSLKAFSGTIIERTDNLVTNSQKQSDSQPSKPVSRFKMLRR